jgi:hypothetical protein
MRDLLEESAGTAEPAARPAVALLTRAAAVTGFLFGLGLLALLGAGQASADEQNNAPAEPRPDVIASVAKPLGDLTASAVRPAAPLVEQAAPVVRPLVAAAEPVVRPVLDTARPLVSPVATTVAKVAAPVVNSVAPAVEPLTAPLVRAVEPVARASGVGGVVSGLTGQHTTPRQPEPHGVHAPAVTEPSAGTVAVPVLATRLTTRFAAQPDERATHARSTGDGRGGRPGVPPGSDAVPGGAGAGGSGNAHGGDGLASVPSTSSGVDGPGLRSPPGDAVSMSWLAFSDRDHPS